MMSLFWYYRPEHTQGGRNPSIHCEVRSKSVYTFLKYWFLSGQQVVHVKSHTRTLQTDSS